jgi:hypothetical protein
MEGLGAVGKGGIRSDHFGQGCRTGLHVDCTSHQCVVNSQLQNYTVRDVHSVSSHSQSELRIQRSLVVSTFL